MYRWPTARSALLGRKLSLVFSRGECCRHDNRIRGLCVNIGVVVIGRNEGKRLGKCLESVTGTGGRVVYVDSASSDGSADLARAMGVEVVELVADEPLSAGRARNAGFRCLRGSAGSLDYVQFVDGDCELADRWLEKASQFLRDHERVAAVCGRLRERYPERSIYNMLCDIEWDTPVGEAKACGGIAMVRVTAFEDARGYREELIAGEEPELCVRLRAAGWRVWRLGEEMALHDAAILRFGQWWKRTVRTGHAFAQGASLHGGPPEHHFVRESRSALLWGLGIPIGAAGLSLVWGGWASLLLLAYPLQVVRLAMQGKRSARQNWLHAGFLVLGKFPEALGHMKFLLYGYLGGQSRLIEYK